MIYVVCTNLTDDEPMCEAEAWPTCLEELMLKGWTHLGKNAYGGLVSEFGPDYGGHCPECSVKP